jgi:hypothetical protein
MSVSRKSAPEEKYVGASEYQKEEDFEMTQQDYLQDKKAVQGRSGYAPISDEELSEKAVDEKLPMGSQSY